MVFQAVQLELFDQLLLKFRLLAVYVVVVVVVLEQEVVSLRRCQSLKEHHVSISECCSGFNAGLTFCSPSFGSAASLQRRFLSLTFSLFLLGALPQESSVARLARSASCSHFVVRAFTALR